MRENSLWMTGIPFTSFPWMAHVMPTTGPGLLDRYAYTGTSTVPSAPGAMVMKNFETVSNGRALMSRLLNTGKLTDSLAFGIEKARLTLLSFLIDECPLSSSTFVLKDPITLGAILKVGVVL